MTAEQPSLFELPVEQRSCGTVELFAGPGGWGVGAQILGIDLDCEGIELDRDACDTAIAAGHQRRHADVRAINPAEYLHCTGFIASPPCATFSAAGKQSGVRDLQVVFDVWTSIGWGIPASQALSELRRVEDQRTALLAVAGVWALTLLAEGRCEWAAFEQVVPGIEYAWEDLAAELTSIGCEYVNVGILDAADYGVPARRRRAFLVASRNGQPATARNAAPGHPPTCPTNLSLVPAPQQRSMATALGWEDGFKVRTRGDRRPTGGGDYSADGPSWALTGRTRSWTRDDGRLLTPAEAGLLQGFPRDYPWRGRSRTAQFRQIGDVISPIMAAHVLASAIGIDPQDAVEDYLATLYDHPAALGVATGEMSQMDFSAATAMPHTNNRMLQIVTPQVESL